MSMSLPEKPSIEHLKNQAKSILKSHKNKEASCCKVLRNLTGLKTKPDKEILKIPLTLQKVQFALAIDYGFKSRQEFKDEIHACFYVYSKVKSSDLKKSIIESLNFAIDMFANPQNYSFEYYGIGPEAYSNWINAAKEFGATHGNWWNAMVWAECRSMASKYFSEIGKIFTNVNELTFKLEKIYESISCNLIKISDTSMKFDDKIALLKKTLTEEHNAIEKIYYLKNRLIK